MLKCLYVCAGMGVCVLYVRHEGIHNVNVYVSLNSKLD